MPFWTYMLHCADRSFYVGHTDNLEGRIGAHQSGEIEGYTSARLPVKLVWSSEFSTRYEALEAERRIKGWSRAKKLALIRGDWDEITRLAKGKDRASNLRRAQDRPSSARTDEGEESQPPPDSFPGQPERSP